MLTFSSVSAANVIGSEVSFVGVAKHDEELLLNSDCPPFLLTKSLIKLIKMSKEREREGERECESGQRGLCCNYGV